MITLKQWRKRTDNALLLIKLYSVIDEDATPESIRFVLKYALKNFPVLERVLLEESKEKSE